METNSMKIVRGHHESHKSTSKRVMLKKHSTSTTTTMTNSSLDIEDEENFDHIIDDEINIDSNDEEDDDDDDDDEQEDCKKATKSLLVSQPICRHLNLECDNLKKNRVDTDNNTPSINLFISTANLGNAEPTQESIATWIPLGGKELRQKNNNRVVVGEKREHFDIIVVGLQEATFTTTTSSPPDLVSSMGSSKSNSSLDFLVPTRTKVKGVMDHIFTPLLGLGASINHSTNNDNDNNHNHKIHMDNIGGTKVLQHRIMQRLGPKYKCGLNFQRGEMRLMIWLHSDIQQEVEETGGILVNAENTGFGSVMANKGGIVASLTIRKTRIAIISAHLEAHEGTTHYYNRCSNVDEILGGTKVGPTHESRMYDATLTHHFCFFLGDLNFRLNPDILDGRLSTKQAQQRHNHHKAHNHQENLQNVLDMIEKEEWHKLNQLDELHHGIHHKHLLSSFETLQCTFPPTFKVRKGKRGFVYDSTRLPSYTDRILWRTADDLKNNLRPLFYEPIPSFITSDHKPIRSGFTIFPREPYNSDSIDPSLLCDTNVTCKSKHGHGNIISLVLYVSKIKCYNLSPIEPNDGISLDGKRENKSSTKCHPYVMFVTDPFFLLKGRGNTTNHQNVDNDNTFGTEIFERLHEFNLFDKLRTTFENKDGYFNHISKDETLSSEHDSRNRNVRLHEQIHKFREIMHEKSGDTNSTSESIHTVDGDVSPTTQPLRHEHQGTDLKVKEKKAKSNKLHKDHYIRREYTRRGWPRTRRLKNKMNPKWKSCGDGVILRMKGVSSKDMSGAAKPMNLETSLHQMAGSFLYISAMHYDYHGDKLIGTVPINMERFSPLHSPQNWKKSNTNKVDENIQKLSDFLGLKECLESGNECEGVREINFLSSMESKVDEPLLRNGRVHGRLTCTIDAVWYSHKNIHKYTNDSIWNLQCACFG